MLLFRDVGTFNTVLRMMKNERTAFGRNHPGPFRERREDGERKQQTHSNYRRLHTKHQFLVSY